MRTRVRGTVTEKLLSRLGSAYYRLSERRLRVMQITAAWRLGRTLEHSRISIEDAESSFLAMLARAGVDRAQPDVPKTWAVFKAFARLPVACAEDDVLVECGTPLDESGPFHLSFKRQFVIEEGDRYDHMEQLICQFSYERHQELEDLHLSLWSMGFAALDAYFAHIEGLSAFQIPVSTYRPTAVDIFQEVV